MSARVGKRLSIRLLDTGAVISACAHQEIGICALCRAEDLEFLLTPPYPFPGVEIQKGAIVEPDVIIGPGSRIGYYSIVRGNVWIGKNFRLGALASIEGDVTIGDNVKIRGKCEIPNSIIGDRVSIYSGVKFYDTPNPPDGPNLPPVIKDDVTICCDAAILGGVTVGAGAFIGARVFVTADVPPHSRVTVESSYRVRPL